MHFDLTVRETLGLVPFSTCSHILYTHCISVSHWRLSVQKQRRHVHLQTGERFRISAHTVGGCVHVPWLLSCRDPLQGSSSTETRGAVHTPAQTHTHTLLTKATVLFSIISVVLVKSTDMMSSHPANLVLNITGSVLEGGGGGEGGGREGERESTG